MSELEVRTGNFVSSIIVEDATASVDSGTPLAITGQRLTNAYPIHTSIVDGNGNQITTFGGGIQNVFRSIDIDESEEQVKATSGNIYSISAFNTTNAPLYLKLYNATAADVTVGTTTPKMTFLVPGNADSDGAGFIWNNSVGIEFDTAITVACTTGIADNDTGAPGANACLINIGYV